MTVLATVQDYSGSLSQTTLLLSSVIAITSLTWSLTFVWHSILLRLSHSLTLMFLIVEGLLWLLSVTLVAESFLLLTLKATGHI